ncbi:MAG TPA: hypothetical protein VH912_12750 [Streptosporangiaceae bacterium]|jgi:DNA-binding transcriptional ArsR family regulator
MLIEETTVERRVVIHAALAEPARLAVVDTLALGDASPGELGAALALPSNLLTPSRPPSARSPPASTSSTQ